MLNLKITDSDILNEGEPQYVSRISKYGSRGVLLNNKGQIALMYVSDSDIYKLPGGGIEEDETEEQAFIREIKEETGYHCHILSYLGIVEEHKAKKDFLHISHCYYAETIGKKGSLKLTKEEKKRGYKPHWFDLNLAIEILEECFRKSIGYRTLFVLKRDLAILYYVKGLTKNE